MLSFFSKKKPSPATPPEEIIQGPEPPQNSNGDEFVFVDKKTDESPKSQGNTGLYPPVSNFGLPYAMPSIGGSNTSTNSMNPLQGVPFNLAPQLCNKSAYEVMQMQVDGILAVLTRQMSVTDDDEYNFSLERAVQNECY